MWKSFRVLWNLECWLSRCLLFLAFDSWVKKVDCGDEFVGDSLWLIVVVRFCLSIDGAFVYHILLL